MSIFLLYYAIYIPSLIRQDVCPPRVTRIKKDAPISRSALVEGGANYIALDMESLTAFSKSSRSVSLSFFLSSLYIS